MTIPSLRDFQAKGWFLSQEGLNRIIAENENLKSIEDYIACAKNMDLCHLTTIPALKEESELPSPFILQVVDIKRKKLTAAATKASGGLTITFTDGQNQYKAAEILGKVECIKPYTAPGSKYLVIKPIEIKDQILVLGPGMLKEEGGYVKELVSNWKKAKKLARKPLKKTVTAPQVDKTVEEKDTNVKENDTKRKPKRTVKKKKKSQQPENTTNNKEQEKKEDLPSSSRVPTPALSETSQKKKKHRKPKANKKVTVPVEEDDSTQKPTNQEEVEKEQSPIIEEPVIKETEEQPLVEEEEKPATETISSSSDISPVSENKSNNSNNNNNNNRLVHHPIPQPHVLAPPPLPYPHPQQQEYYYQGQPTMFMDYSMMVPVPMYHQPYMPPPYMQHVYYVTTDQQQQHQQPPPHHYYTYQPHYTQIYDEGCYGPPYYHPHP